MLINSSNRDKLGETKRGVIEFLGVFYIMNAIKVIDYDESDKKLEEYLRKYFILLNGLTYVIYFV